MLSFFKNVSKYCFAVVLPVIIGSSAFAQLRPAGKCQTKEVVTVCPTQLNNGEEVIQVIYDGYLLGKGHPILAVALLNGQKFAYFLDQRQWEGAGPWHGITYLPYAKGHLVIAFYNDLGEAHDLYGQKFQFDF